MQDDVVDAKRVAYVLTHYPRLALTFIAGEIDEIERLGGTVFPIVMNRPDPSELTTADATQRSQRSLYLKSSKARLGIALSRAFARRPWRMTRLLGVALRSAGHDLGLVARRIVHLAYGARTAEYCRQHDIRHLHAHFGQSPATIAWFAAEIMKISDPDATNWSFTIHGFQDFVDEAIARLDMKAASARFVICVSDFTRSQLCRVTEPKYWDNFHVVRCGIDVDAFPLRDTTPVRNRPRIVIVGRLSPEKGHVTLLEALPLLAADERPPDMVVIGSGPFEATLRAQAERLGVADRVSFLGELPPEEVARQLAAADIFCMASFAEGLPISIMEAMAIGVPVVTTWISGIPELAVNERTAMTVPPGNSRALADAIRRVIEDEALRTRMIASARAAVERAHVRRDNVPALAELFWRDAPALERANHD